MASSSSSAASSQSPKKYDVFISFRGEDTRFNFRSHLLEALRSKQIHTYTDDDWLEKGDELWPSLEKAIEDSTLFLVIFSKNYASSTWCLKELAKILECSKNDGHLVMPVFYRVHPSCIRNQSGSYQKAFEQHEHDGIDEHQLQKWREALTHAANFSGWHCGVHRNQADLIKEIIEHVEQKLDNKYHSEDYLKDLIGIHRKMAEVQSLLYKGSDADVRFIGIWGMVGVGKTTLARALFDKYHSEYEGSCFLSSVRKESKIYGMDALKKKLISKLLGDKETHIDMVNDEIFLSAIRRRSRKKVFVVLDDVDDHQEQLENLAGRLRWFDPGSKVLVTTRDKQVFGKEVDYIYKVEALNYFEAFQLFSFNAFKEGYDGDPNMRQLAREVTRYAGGNPWALKVLGSFLYDKTQEEWKSQLKKFQNLPFKIINDTLKLSFGGLDAQEENIFLDLACFFIGSYVRDIEPLLDACDCSTSIGLKILEDKTLIDICEEKISMHNLIKEMGRQIVREQSLNDLQKRSRLWDAKEIFEIFKENKGGDAIEGIILETSELLEEICLTRHALCSMPNLKFLIFHEDFREKNKLNCPHGIEFLPNKLKLLCWMGYPSESFPATFKAENLVQIKMEYSKLTKLWDGTQNLVNLRGIDLDGSKDLIELPDFSQAKRLEDVRLNFCSKLQSVHPSLLSLDSLRRLSLYDCKALTSLTSNSPVKSLNHLDLGGCSRLKKIDSLSLNRCERVTSLNNSVDLHTLTRVTDNCCNTPACSLSSLFNEIRTLKHLRLCDCDEIFEVPKNIRLLSSLFHLDLSYTNIETLPLSIKYLSSLHELLVIGCKRLRFLPELPPSISMLCAEDCESLETLHLPHIQNFDVQSEFFSFANCKELDGQSIKAVEKKVLLDINKASCKDVAMEYLGERVPEWFMHRNTNDRVTVDLCSIPETWDGGFIFCVVISASSPYYGILVDAICRIDGASVGTFSHHSSNLKSDHILLWYDQDSFGEVQRKIKEKRGDSESNTCYPRLEIEFRVDYYDDDVEDGRVGDLKECGVCPTSAPEFQNYIQQIQLVSNSHPNSIAIMEERPRKRKSLLRRI